MDPLKITDKKRLFEMLAGRRKGKARVIDESEMNAALKARVQGQDHIIDELCHFIRLQWGKERRGKPIASVLFVGAPATGKTELAKAMAEYLFDDEKNMIFLECVNFSGPEAKNTLIGMPTGYVGASQGGRLTRPMFSNPRRLILFDEIEKAYSGIFDLLLPLLGDGRLTEQGSGKVADYTQAVIVLTSNAEQESIGKLADQIDDPHELDGAVRSVFREAKTFRPEIISRFDQIYVFRPLSEETRARIAGLKIAKAGEEYGVTIEHIAPELVFEIVTQGEEGQDARGLTRAVDAKVGALLLEAKELGFQSVSIRLDEQGKPIVSEGNQAK